MTIAIICDVFGEANNGTTIAAINLINALREKGHTVRVVCPDEKLRGVPDYFIAPTYDFGPFNGYVAKNGVAPARVDREVLESAVADADVIHVMLPFSLGKSAAIYAHEHDIPLTAGFHCQAENVTSHVFLQNSALASRETYRIFYDRLYKYCDAIHYPTQFICDTFENVVGPTPHYIISNGVDSKFVPRKTEKSAEIRDKFVVLFTGRLSREKSHSVLIDGVAKSKYSKDIQLIFAGEGPLETDLRHRAEKCGINPPEIRFYSRNELIDVINSADLYVHPAEIEIEAISCLEAIACGKVPLIADSPKSATRYFALGENNLFRHNDPDDLAKKLDWWIEHPEERMRCREEYLGYARKFDFRKCMDEMEEMLIRTVEEKRRETETHDILHGSPEG